jgi:DNA-binding NarL/FixJ family response regulator
VSLGGTNSTGPDRRAKREIAPRASRHSFDSIGPRLQEAARLIGTGMSYKEAAHRMGITHESFKVYVSEWRRLSGVTACHARVAALRSELRAWIERHGSRCSSEALAELMGLLELPTAPERYLD